MKVLHVIPSLGPLRGGPSFVLPVVAEGLAARGMTVEVAATDDNGAEERLPVPLGQPLRQRGVTYWYFPRQTRFYLASLPLTRWLWRNMRAYSLVHIHALFSYASNAAAWIARARGVPYIIRPLGLLNRYGMERRRPWLKAASFRLCERPLLEHAAAVQYTTEQERAEAEALGFAARPVIIPNPVDAPVAAEPGRFRARHPAIQGKLLVLFLSRIDEKKGLDLLIPAFAQLRCQAPEARLAIAGSGPETLVGRLKQQAADLGVARQVLWLGFVEGQAKAELLRDADIFVLPSYSENFGVAVVEAMQQGIPVVVSDQVGLHREIAAHQAGLVTPCEVGALSETLIRLALQPDTRGMLAERGRAFAMRFATAEVCAKLQELYQRVAA
jgi:glycosyltransferase involved in cell wall biosynthesis